MKLDLSQAVTKEEVYEHFELFKEAYVFCERFGASDPMHEQMDWFDENAPNFFPTMDKWVFNHIMSRNG